MKIIALFLLFISSVLQPVMSFNNKRCEKYLERYGADLSSPMTSTTQGISSFGECSLLGDRPNEIKHYFISNYQSIKIEASKGGGEYLLGLTKLYSCNDEGADRLIKYTQKHFSELFDLSPSSKLDDNILYENFKSGLLKDTRFFYNCII